MLLAKLAEQAGVPKGVLNVVHGGVDTVNFICDAPEIKAISFVGSNQAGRYIFARGTQNGKRVQVLIKDGWRDGKRERGVTLYDLP